jgi:uncharacterized protein YggU (UPF0235/DUF167 family)
VRPPASSCEHRLRRILRRFLRRLQKRTPGDPLKIEVIAPPEKGRANEAVIEILADCLGVGTDDIKVVSGHSSPSKVVAVPGMDDEAIKKAVG